MNRYKYYEEDTEQVLNEFELLKLFYSEDMKEQREWGTTFNTWIEELEHMQLLIREEV